MLFHVLEGPEKTQRTIENRQQTHAENSVGTDNVILVRFESFSGFQEQE